MSLELPRPLGPFLLLRHLASGGMGDVYLAHQKLGETGERLCVVKTVRADSRGPGDDTLMMRFMDEARTTGFLNHKNVASVIDVGKADGTAYMAVEHVAGRDLQTVMKRAKRMAEKIPEEVSLYVISELLEALSYVHQAKHPRSLEDLKIVHRDISPHNVMVSFAGEVKLIDFGIARSTVKRELTQAGQAIGKIRYMSPEQARAEIVDSATDVWAASIVASELLSGRGFWGDIPLEQILLNVASGQKPRPPALMSLDKPMRDALKKGLSTKREKRPSAQALKDSLQAATVVRGSSEALRALLATLFAGDEEEERKAYAMLLQAPEEKTSAQAAAKLWTRTAQEETPPRGSAQPEPSEFGGMDAKTASRLATPGELASHGINSRSITDKEAPDAADAAADVADARDAFMDPDASDDDLDENERDVATVASPHLRSKRESGPGGRMSNPQSRASFPRSVDAGVPAHSQLSVLSASGSASTRSGGLGSRPSSRARVSPVAAGSAVIIAACTLLGLVAVVLKGTETPATKTLVQPKASPSPDDFDPPPEDRSKLPPSVLPVTQDAAAAAGTAPAATVVEVPSEPADARAIAKARAERVDRERAKQAAAPPTTPKSKEKPTLLGDRVKMLRACKPQPSCATPVLRRVAGFADLTADELKALDNDVDWCIDQCR